MLTASRSRMTTTDRQRGYDRAMKSLGRTLPVAAYETRNDVPVCRDRPEPDVDTTIGPDDGAVMDDTDLAKIIIAAAVSALLAQGKHSRVKTLASVVDPIDARLAARHLDRIGLTLIRFA